MCYSAYLHVPFCNEICSYCDFTRCRYHAGLANSWLIQIQNDIKEKLKDVQLTTMYIGGGTPSALSARQLNELLQALAPYTAACNEYTIEANVESFDTDKIKMCVEAGVNRVSLGVQTLQPALLQMINRHHTRAAILKVIQDIHRAGIDNISIDVMYGLPNQTMAMWKKDLEDIVVNFSIEHISLYALTIEEHSAFGRQGVQPADPELEADMYEYAIEYLTSHGFEHYEISSFAKNNQQSQHNKAYWHYDDFVGLGCGASGKQAHTRYDNTKNLHTYITKGASAKVIELSKADEMFEMVMMSLRMKEGLSLQRFKEVFHEDATIVFEHQIQKHMLLHHLCKSETHIFANEKGMEVLHDILVDFLPDEM